MAAFWEFISPDIMRVMDDADREQQRGSLRVRLPRRRPRRPPRLPPQWA